MGKITELEVSWLMHIAEYHHVRDDEIGGKCSTCGIRGTRTVFCLGDMSETNSLVDVSVDGAIAGIQEIHFEYGFICAVQCRASWWNGGHGS